MKLSYYSAHNVERMGWRVLAEIEDPSIGTIKMEVTLPKDIHQLISQHVIAEYKRRKEQNNAV